VDELVGFVPCVVETAVYTTECSPADYKVKRMKGRNCFELLRVGGWMNAERP